MRFKSLIAALGTAILFALTFAPSPAGAVSICAHGIGCAFFGGLTMEECNALIDPSNTEAACFMFPTAGGSGPVLQRLNGQATLLIDKNSFPVVVATPGGEKTMMALLPHGDRKTADRDMVHKAFQEAFRTGSRTVDDSTATAVARQFKARIDVVKGPSGPIPASPNARIGVPLTGTGPTFPGPDEPCRVKGEHGCIPGHKDAPNSSGPAR
jgi:hypothetical protein